MSTVPRGLRLWSHQGYRARVAEVTMMLTIGAFPAGSDSASQVGQKCRPCSPLTESGPSARFCMATPEPTGSQSRPWSLELHGTECGGAHSRALQWALAGLGVGELRQPGQGSGRRWEGLAKGGVLPRACAALGLQRSVGRRHAGRSRWTAWLAGNRAGTQEEERGAPDPCARQPLIASGLTFLSPLVGSGHEAQRGCPGPRPCS